MPFPPPERFQVWSSLEFDLVQYFFIHDLPASSTTSTSRSSRIPFNRMFVNDQSLGEAPSPTPQPVLFLKIRVLLFSSIIFLSFIWIILLSIAIFVQWDLMNHTERSLILMILVIDTFTVVMLPLLLLQPFRSWLDAARFLFVFLSHSGIAFLFAIKKSAMHCSSPVADQEAVCGLVILFVIITSWFIPALAVLYICGLAYLGYRRSTVPSETTCDIEKKITVNHESLTPSTIYGYAI